MFRKNPQLHKRPDSSAIREGSAIKAAIKKRTKRIRRRIGKTALKTTLVVQDPNTEFAGELADFELTANQVLKGVTTHGRMMKNDPIFRRRIAVA